MMRYFLLLASLTLTSGVALAQQDTSVRILLREVIGVLASDSMKGRATGSAEINASLSYLQHTFKTITRKKLRTQDFTIALNDSTTIQATNAYCFLNNHAKSTVIIGAHYDHIGLGGPLSRSFLDNTIHNGADDNASGVAMTLALAQALTTQRNTHVNFLFVFYSGHEIGLYGSSVFYKELLLKTKRFGKTDRVFNFDMIGRLDFTSHILRCTTYPEKDSLLFGLPDMHGLDLREGNPEILLNLDTKAFVEAGIPTINLTTGVHYDYHRPTDDACYIHYDGMQQIYELLRDLFLHYTPSSDTQKNTTCQSE